MTSSKRHRGPQPSQVTRRWRPCTAEAVHAGPGCYALFDAKGLLYIGSAVNLRKRLSDQGFIGRMPKPLARFVATKALKLKACGSEQWGDWLMREARLIRRLQPPMNAIHARHRKPPTQLHKAVGPQSFTRD